MLIFQRDDWEIEVDPILWSEILEFFESAGWTPAIPTHLLPKSSSICVDEVSAHAFTEAGNVVLEETMKNPTAAYSTIRFDMGKFAELVEFASHGEFIVKQRA